MQIPASGSGVAAVRCRGDVPELHFRVLEGAHQRFGCWLSAYTGLSPAIPCTVFRKTASSTQIQIFLRCSDIQNTLMLLKLGLSFPPVFNHLFRNCGEPRNISLDLTLVSC